MAAPKKPEAELAPIIIVKRVIADDHGEAHHGGAWKIAYADFVTAMMAFFMLLWIVGATNEAQRRGIADYFTPTLVKLSSTGSGSNGVLQGRTLDVEGKAPGVASRMMAPVMPRHPGERGGDPEEELARQLMQAADRSAFKRVEQAIDARLAADPALAELRRQIRYVQTREGLRIEIIDRAGFSMFELASDRLVPRAAQLMGAVAKSVDGLPNPIAVRGHTDSLRYADPNMNNWRLSAYRAEATRASFARAGLPEARFARVEGVSDTDPFIAADPMDPRNRRISVTLLYRDR